MKRSELLNQRVVILGYGREGRATHQALCRMAKPCHAKVWVEQALSPEDHHDILRPFDQGLMDFDVAIRSPGIPIEHPALCAFREQGGQVINPSSIWFSERPDVPVIGVTGSKGKSTTASLIGFLMNALGQPTEVVGNIGRPLISLIDEELGPSTWLVAELSSYQLADLSGQLRLGVITRLFPEHVDWHGSVDHYYGAKRRLFELAAPHGVLTNAQDPILVRETATEVGVCKVNDNTSSSQGLYRHLDAIYWNREPVLESVKAQLPGHHNLDNIVMALETVRTIGVLSDERLAEAAMILGTFQPLAHRLSTIRSDSNVRWINDSIATTPHATLAALQSLKDSAVVLIVGGYERGGDWSEVIDYVRGQPLLALIALPDNGERIMQAFSEAAVLDDQQIFTATDMVDAVAQASRIATQGATPSTDITVLLSPGSPSFGRYRDFEERGSAFSDAVAAL